VRAEKKREKRLEEKKKEKIDSIDQSSLAVLKRQSSSELWIMSWEDAKMRV